MKFLPAGFNTKDLEKGTKNKWRWEWLSEVDENVLHLHIQREPVLKYIQFDI